MNRLFTHIQYPLITALGYWAMGALAGFFAIPPGFASPIWPAAGFAFLMVLMVGRRTVLGVGLGSFVLNVGFGGGSVFEPSSEWVPAIIIAVGASCQSLTAWWFVRRFTRFPNIVQRPNDAVLLGLFGGPLACVVSSGVGVFSLVYSGVIAPVDAGINWLHWWVGDSIGVLIFCPIILALCLSLAWAKKTTLFTFFVVYLCSIFVATTIFVSSRNSQEQKIEQLFSEKVAGMHTSLVKQLQNIIHTSGALSSVFSVFREVDYRHFENYARNVSLFTTGTHALSWVPIVSKDERKQFELHASLQLAREFSISERDASGQLVKAESRSRYFPVTYIEPMLGNEAALGFDLGSQVNRLKTIELVLSKKSTGATAPITLVQEKEEQSAFLILAPVLDGRGEVTSLVSSVYRVHDLLAATLGQSTSKFVAVTLSDITNPEEPEIFYQQHVKPTGLTRNIIVPFAHRIWKVEFSPSVEYVRRHQTLDVWVVLIGGFAVVTMFGLFILFSLSRSELVENEVKAKTKELNSALMAAEQANSVKSSFLASMSHELRTPLNSIIGFSVRLNKTYAGDGDAKLINALGVIERNGKHLLNLINDILDLSKVEAGKMSITRESVNVLALMEEVNAIMGPLAESKNLQLITGGTCVETIDVDKQRLLQVMINLVSNAIKYTSQGQVCVYTLLESRQKIRGLAIVVSDTGVGIKPDDLPRVFHRYERLDDPFHAGEVGTGLGLALAEELVSLHDGELSVRSEYGKGSRFTCWLPL